MPASCRRASRSALRPIGQTEVAAPVDAEDGTGRLGFTLANLEAAERRRLAAGQIENADRGPLGLERGDGAAAPISASSGWAAMIK